jgi:hypothetical protein
MLAFLGGDLGDDNRLIPLLESSEPTACRDLPRAVRRHATGARA